MGIGNFYDRSLLGNDPAMASRFAGGTFRPWTALRTAVHDGSRNGSDGFGSFPCQVVQRDAVAYNNRKSIRQAGRFAEIDRHRGVPNSSEFGNLNLVERLSAESGNNNRMIVVFGSRFLLITCFKKGGVIMPGVRLLCNLGYVAAMTLALGCILTVPTLAQDDHSSLASGEDNSRSFPKYSEFASQWTDEAWIPRTGSRFIGHMRDLKDGQWKLRMLALQEVVSAGKAAVPMLIDRLVNGASHERIFAAQALGYLGKDAPIEPLLKAVRDDDDAAVQLYAVDSLGMRGDAELGARWADFANSIRNRDVMRHMKYAEERAGVGIDQSIIDTLSSWNSSTISTAKVGQPAPEFELTTVGGESVKLEDFRGKSNVVLVFIYGDT